MRCRFQQEQEVGGSRRSLLALMELDEPGSNGTESRLYSTDQLSPVQNTWSSELVTGAFPLATAALSGGRGKLTTLAAQVVAVRNESRQRN